MGSFEGNSETSGIVRTHLSSVADRLVLLMFVQIRSAILISQDFSLQFFLPSKVE